MASELFELLEQLMIDTFSIKLTQFEKIGSIGKNFISVGTSIIKFYFRNKNSITFFGTFTLSLFDIGVGLTFNKSKAKPRKLKIEHEQI